MSRPHFLYLFLILLLCNACQELASSSNETVNVQLFSNPAMHNSAQPNLHCNSKGEVLLSWLQENNDRSHSLYYSTLQHQQWSESANLVASGSNWLANWADFPSLTSFGDSSLAVHYLVERSDAAYAYDIFMRFSEDRGKNWSESTIPHSDSTNTEHGFVSMLAVGDTLMVFWLDGRNYELIAVGDSSPSNEMQLYTASYDKKGKLGSETVLDNRVCSCCQTDATLTAEGPLVVYRDRSASEIRDISIIKWKDGSWQQASKVLSDEWEIAGCPVNGPSLDAKGHFVVLTWFTAARDTSKVMLAISEDAGNSFSKTLIIDDSNPVGRVDLAIMNDSTAVVSWLDQTQEGALIKVCKVTKDGTMGSPIEVAQMSAERSGGFPRMISLDNAVYLAWTDQQDSSQIKTVKVTWHKNSL